MWIPESKRHEKRELPSMGGEKRNLMIEPTLLHAEVPLLHFTEVFGLMQNFAMKEQAL
jgi:hypothetical protein